MALGASVGEGSTVGAVVAVGTVVAVAGTAVGSGVTLGTTAGGVIVTGTGSATTTPESQAVSMMLNNRSNKTGRVLRQPPITAGGRSASQIGALE